MKSPRVQQVIISEQELRGQGTQENPMRRVLQVFTLNGELIAENDPLASPQTLITISEAPDA